ncbi:MAG: VanZ family protein [Candidatus Eisenbacteria bacterium]
MNVPRWISAWLPVLLLELLILFLSSRPGLTGHLPWRHLDKVAHFSEYAALGGLIFRALRLSGGRPRDSVLATWGLIAVLAMADEGLQSRIPGRVSSLADWLADVCGAGAGIWISALVGRRFGGHWEWRRHETDPSSSS